MKWLKVNEETYYDVYECSHCHARIMVDEVSQLPCYCKNCERVCEDDEE